MKADIIWDDDSETTVVILLEPIEVDGWTVPAGFASDGGSIPRLLWPWCSPLDGRYLHIYVLHDWLFDTHVITRAQADRTLLDLLILAGMRRTQAYAIYCAVRLFGWRHHSDTGNFVSGVRAYSRELSSDEMQSLASEFRTA